MRRNTLRYLAPIALLAVGAALATAQRFGKQAASLDESAGQPAHIVYVDVGGWYQTTPAECAVLSAHDLRADALPASLPEVLGPWRGVELDAEESVMTFYGQPDLLMQRRYEDAQGQAVWLTAIASRGPKSYRTFEHTPHICYPSTGWATLQDDTRQISLDEGAITVRRGLFELEGTRFLVYYWYQWDTPRRDAAEGISSWRLTTDATQDLSLAHERLAAFVRLLFVEVVAWQRF
ncbi:MAG: EpsI family protein [Chloroflexi bacterium]|nr:EpsI family protein [Chloroflexota bacterium]